MVYWIGPASADGIRSDTLTFTGSTAPAVVNSVHQEEPIMIMLTDSAASKV